MPEKDKEIWQVNRPREKARISYNRISRWYDFFAGSSEKKYRDAGLQKLDVREGDKVLEIGFGTGHCILALVGLVGDLGKVCGIDISEGMCKVTFKRIKQAGLLERVELYCSDACALPFKEGSFDKIFMSFTLELFDTQDIPLVLRECKRVLKSEGKIGIVAMSMKCEDNIMMKLYKWFHDKFPNLVDCRPIYVKKSLDNADFGIIESEELKMWGLLAEIVVGKK